MKRKLMWGALAAMLAQGAVQSPEEWRRPFAAHRVIGNVYYVGTYDLACFLIVTPQGNILINTGLEDSAPLLRKSMADLGFKLEDVRWLMTTQAHYDHVAALAEMKRLTGAKVLASQADAVLLEDGGKSDFRFGPEYGYAPVKVDERIADGQKLRLGGVELTAYVHSGHTRGSLSYGLTVHEGGKDYRVLIANMGSINPGVKLLHNARYRRSPTIMRGPSSGRRRWPATCFSPPMRRSTACTRSTRRERPTIPSVSWIRRAIGPRWRVRRTATGGNWRKSGPPNPETLN